MPKKFVLNLANRDAVKSTLRSLLLDIRDGDVTADQRSQLDELVRRLREAVERGDTKLLEDLAQPKTGKYPNDREPSLLLWAAMDGHLDLVDALLASGADPNEKYNDVCALSAAACTNQVAIVERLFAAGADVNDKAHSMDVLSFAVKTAGVDIVERLLQAGANVNPEKATSSSPLARAVEVGNAKLVERLIEAGANINPEKSISGSPLLQAVRTGNVALATRLIDAGADVDFTWSMGGGLLAEAIGVFAAKLLDDEPHDETAMLDIIGLLVDRGCGVDTANNMGRTPLMMAVEANQLAAVEKLLAVGADPNITAKKPAGEVKTSLFNAAPDESTALILAAKEGRLEIAKRLLESGADVNATDFKKLSALEWAKRNGHHELGELLIAAGAEVDTASPHVLLAAAAQGDLETVRDAIAAGCDVNTQDEAGTLNDEVIGATPLIRACQAGQSEVVAELLAAGADIEMQSHAFPTSINPLMAAAEAGHLTVVQQLLDAGADIGAKNQGFEGARMQPIHFAAERGDADIVQLFLDRGAKANAKAADKVTPLHCAVSSGDLATVECLLAAGANPHAKTGFDTTPRGSLEYAEKKNKKIGPVLQAAEASTPKKKPKLKKKSEPALPLDWENAEFDVARPDFATAANTPEYAQAIELVAEQLDAQATENEHLPGAKLFKTTRGKAAALVDDRREQLADLNAMVFHGLGRGAFQDDDPDLLALVPTSEWEQAVAFIGTGDPNGGKGPGQILAGLRQLYELRPFVINEIAHDKIAGRFTADFENSRALAMWKEAFCSDIIYQGMGSVSKLAKELKESDRLYFWWD